MIIILYKLKPNFIKCIKHSIIVGICSILILFHADSFAQYSPEKFAIAPSIKQKVYSFPLGDVQITDELFSKPKDKVHAYLLKWNLDSLLYWHRKAAGLKPKAPGHYKGWESGGSNILGHYLTALSLMYATTKDKELLNRVNYIVDELALCQQNARTGAVFNGLEFEKAFDEMRKGTFNYRLVGPEFPVVNGGNYFYGIHKNIAGLRDAYLLANNQKAKEVLVRYVDWINDFVNAIPTEKFQELLNVEHGGMAEVIADAYGITGNKTYEELSKKFVQHRIADPVAQGVDMLYPQHANSRIPQFVGYGRMYELMGKDADSEGEAASKFWDIVIRDHTLVNGGNSEYERFGPAGQVSQRIGMSSSETCNTYNMLKLSHELYERTADTKYIDYYERALYNHILASVDDEGMFCYYVSTKPGWFKTFSTPFNSNWCCVGTGMENPGKYEQDIYAHDDNNIYVNLFISSVVNWKEHGFALKQQTRFPQSDTVFLKVLSVGKETGIKFRRPSWLNGQAQISVNKKIQQVAVDNGYLTISQKAKKGDIIRIVLPMSLRVEETPDNAAIGAILYGPILLAGELGRKGIENLNPHASDMWEFKNNPELKDIPVLVVDKQHPDTWISEVKGKPLTFNLQSADNKKVLLRPFYTITDQRYSVYWDLFSNKQWQDYEGYLKNYLKDEVIAGDSLSETSHHLQSRNDTTENIYFKTCRSAKEDGQFSYDLKSAKGDPSFLVIKYWGGGWGPDPSGLLDIYVENIKIATHDLGNKIHETTFYDLNYAIPVQLTKGQEKLNVLFKAKSGKTISGIFSCKLVTAQGLVYKDLLKDQ